MKDNIKEISRMCDDHARQDAERSREVIDAGPFRALLSRNTDLIWLNYAVPTGPLGDAAQAHASLAELRRAFAARGRRLRFEFNALAWPGLAPLLEQAGLELHAEQPLMVCEPHTLRPFEAAGARAELLGEASGDELLAAFLTIQRRGFEQQPAAVTPADVAAMRAGLARSANLQALAWLGGAPASAAALSPIGPVAELAGVATDPAMRRRGGAATVSSFLVREHFRRGGRLAWLSAGDAAAQAVYQLIGFELIDARLNYIEPGGAA